MLVLCRVDRFTIIVILQLTIERINIHVVRLPNLLEYMVTFNHIIIIYPQEVGVNTRMLLGVLAGKHKLVQTHSQCAAHQDFSH